MQSPITLAQQKGEVDDIYITYIPPFFDIYSARTGNNEFVVCSLL